MLTHLEHKKDVPPITLSLLFSGSVPAGGGLSSSAAMTCCSSIAALKAYDGLDLISRTEMTEIAIESERLVGVNSGGLDQAASVFGQQSGLLHVEFVPKLSTTVVPLPKSAVLVIANSLVVA